jgi:hypothetical protein
LPLTRPVPRFSLVKRTLAIPVLVAALALGCEDPRIVATFVPDTAPTAGSVTMAEGGESGDLVTVEILVSGVDDLFGADFDVTFDAALVDYVDGEPAALLGTQPIATVATQSPGHLVIGAARHGSEGSVDVDAPAALMRLTFRALAEGSSPVAFGDADLLPPPIPGGPGTIGNVTWHGGTVVANEE